MKQSIPFSLALVLLIGGVALYRLRDMEYYQSLDDQQAGERPPWVQLVEAKALSGLIDAPFVRNPYAYAPASCAYTGRDAGQEQRALALIELMSKDLRLESRFESNRRWCKNGCSSRDDASVLFQETSGDPAAEGCWVWVEYYGRSLLKQKMWPFCTCKYGWSLIERTCEVTSDTLAETKSRGSDAVAEAFPETALQDAVWASGW